MNDQTRVFVGMAVGALAGAVVTAVCLTERGQDSLVRLDDALDKLTAALGRFRGTLRRAGEAVEEGRALAGDVRTAVLEHQTMAGPSAGVSSE